MDGDALYSIGDLARQTGLTVKGIRFYADRGIVPPTDRSPTGHRRYDAGAVARLNLVRTLRELGLDLATIRGILEREVPLSEAAAVHAEALAVQIRLLRLQRAVLTVVARRGSTPEEMALMHKLARLTGDERRRLIGDFLGEVFGDLDAPEFAGVMRSMTPELPENPDAEQVEAWVELAGLSRDPDFRASMRRMAEQYASERPSAAPRWGEPAGVRRAPAGTGTEPAGMGTGPAGVRRDPAAIVRDRVRPALAAGIDPTSPQADAIVAAVTAEHARTVGRPDDARLRRGLLARLESANDPRRERYLQLLSVINGWSAPESLTPALTWFLPALRARTPR